VDPELVLPNLPPRVETQIVARMVSRDRHEWADQAARTGHCSKPVRLRGRSLAVDTKTGEVRTTYASDWEESEVAFIRCGNRREAVCGACAREYASDTWHLIRAGAASGDKGVPTSVAEHPMVRHGHRPVVRAGALGQDARHGGVHGVQAAPEEGAVPARPSDVVHGRARPGRPDRRAAAVRGLL